MSVVYNFLAMVKGFRQIAVLTLLSRVFGLVRESTFAFFLGASSYMDGWVIAFLIPNLARRLFGEGAAASSLIPVYSKTLLEDKDKALRLASTVISVIFVVLMCFVIIGEVVLWTWRYGSGLEQTQFKLELTGVMLPYMVMICMVALLAGILNAHRHFAMPAFAPVLLNIFIITALLVTGVLFELEPRRQLFIVAFAVLAAGIAQICIQIGPLRRHGVLIGPSWEIGSKEFRRIIFLMGPMIAGLTVTQINTLSDVFVAAFFSGSAEKGEFFNMAGMSIEYPLWEGAVSQLFYSQRLYQFPLGVFGISLATAIFPVMSNDAANKDGLRLGETISKGIRGAVFVAVPSTVGLFLVREPLISVIFERGAFTNEATVETASVLGFYVLGLCGFFAQQIVLRAFYAIEDSKLPSLTALLAVAVNLLLNLVLIWFIGTGGLALSTALCSYLQVIILVSVLRKRFGENVLDGVGKAFLKTFAGVGFMALLSGFVLYLLRDLGGGFFADLIRIGFIVPIAAGSYYTAARFMGMEELSLVISGKKK